MINTSELLGILKINGVSEGSPTADVDAILNALRYGDSDKQQAVEFLKERGWFSVDTRTTVEAPSISAPIMETVATPYSAVPEQVAVPTQPEVVVSASAINASKQSRILLVIIVLLVIVLVMLTLGAVAFAYWQRIDLFEVGPQKTNFIHDLLSKMKSGIPSFN